MIFYSRRLITLVAPQIFILLRGTFDVDITIDTTSPDSLNSKQARSRALYRRHRCILTSNDV